MRAAVESIYGSQQERLLAERRFSTSAQQSIDGCMSSAGFSYPDVDISLPTARTRQIDFFWWSVVEEAIAGSTAYGLFTGPAEAASGPVAVGNTYEGLTETEKQAYDQRLASCATEAFERESDEFLADANRLINDLDARVNAEVERQAADSLTKYADCISDRGYSFTRPSNVYSNEIETIGSESGLFALSPGDPAYGRALGQAAERERQIALSDVHCRSLVLPRLESIILQAYNEWLESNEEAIRDVLAAWSDYRIDNA